MSDEMMADADFLRHGPLRKSAWVKAVKRTGKASGEVMRTSKMGYGTVYCWWPKDERNGNVPPLTMNGAIALLRECASKTFLGGIQVGEVHSTSWRVGCFLSRYDAKAKKAKRRNRSRK